MKTSAILFGIFAGGPAFAHVGHLADVAGHDHWVAGVAVGVAVAVGVWGALKGKPEAADQGSDAETDGDTEPQEA